MGIEKKRKIERIKRESKLSYIVWGWDKRKFKNESIEKLKEGR